MSDAEEKKNFLHSDLHSKINLICGPMSSGKTDSLITTVRELKIVENVSYLIVRPNIDTRSAENHVESMSGEMEQCLVLPAYDGLNYDFIVSIRDKIQVVFIDEAQFFDECLVTFCEHWANVLKKCVYVYALNGDARGHTFGCIHMLLPQCDSIQLLSGFCATCKTGKRGIFTRRLDSKKKEQVEVGKQGVDYVTECRECYNLARV